MKLIVEGTFVLERFSGKGGWTYIRLPGELITTGKAFGMMKVSGSIDDYTFEGKHLLPTGDGTVFMPVAKPIRKEIGKEEGDVVNIKFFKEEVPDQIPEELAACLKDDPGKFELFTRLSTAEQKQWVKHIYAASTDDAKASRILKLLKELKP